MKLCSHSGCTNEIDDKYTFCYAHFKTGQQTDMSTKPKPWSDDPTIDALLKMNSNLGRLVEAVGRQTESMDKQNELLALLITVQTRKNG